MFFPRLSAPKQTRLFTDTFLGLRRSLRVGDGEWYGEENLSSHAYPLLSPRPRRGVVAHLEKPLGLCAREALFWVDGNEAWYGGQKITGLYLTDSPKQLVSMGAYLLIFPDCVYFNTQNFTDFGSINASLSTPEGESVEYEPCTADGSLLDLSAAPTAPQPPDSPANGDYWIDSSAAPHRLMRYSLSQGLWNEVTSCYVRISFPGAGSLFSIWDGITLSGCAADGEDEQVISQISALNASHALYAVGEDFIVVPSLLERSCRQSRGRVTMRRTCPKMDFVIECANRLWGCRYGMQDGKMVNEIYACALGDFKNWNRFLGLSTDSYAVSLGGDGAFTGAVNHLGTPLFFRENAFIRISGSAPSSFQISTLPCTGVEEGSHESLSLVGSTLYYKGADGVYAFDGSLPSKVSQPLGEERYHFARGGSAQGRYYLSMQDEAGEFHLFTLDTRRGLWHREDSLNAGFFTPRGTDLFCVDLKSGRLLSLTGQAGEIEDFPTWCAQSGLQGWQWPGGKYLSRFLLRMELPKGSKVRLYLRYDSCGPWEKQGEAQGQGVGTVLLPVIPRRCDHVQIKLEGEGDMKLLSLCRVLEEGGERP